MGEFSLHLIEVLQNMLIGGNWYSHSEKRNKRNLKCTNSSAWWGVQHRTLLRKLLPPLSSTPEHPEVNSTGLGIKIGAFEERYLISMDELDKKYKIQKYESFKC